MVAVIVMMALAVPAEAYAYFNRGINAQHRRDFKALTLTLKLTLKDLTQNGSLSDPSPNPNSNRTLTLTC